LRVEAAISLYKEQRATIKTKTKTKITKFKTKNFKPGKLLTVHYF